MKTPNITIISDPQGGFIINGREYGQLHLPNATPLYHLQEQLTQALEAFETASIDLALAKSAQQQPDSGGGYG